MSRLLVVDDEPHIRETTRFILELAGYAVEVAGSGAEAMASLAAGGFDAVLLDLMMPGMDGYEVCRRIRREPGFAALPVVILTARWQRDELDRARASGASTLLKKPLDEAALLAFLEAAGV